MFRPKARFIPSTILPLNSFFATALCSTVLGVAYVLCLIAYALCLIAYALCLMQLLCGGLGLNSVLGVRARDVRE